MKIPSAFTCRSSSSSAAQAFAAATAGSHNPRDRDQQSETESFSESAKRKMSITHSAATMRVLSVLRHWITKHSQDFEGSRLRYLTTLFLEDIVCSSSLLPAEHKAATQLLRLLKKDDGATNKLNLRELLKPPLAPSMENISTLSALEIAEEMTFLDQQILFSICSQSVEPSLIKILYHDISISVSSWARPGINQTRKRELRTFLS